jgi:uncharacterized protein YhbP (UPF0306 family)
MKDDDNQAPGKQELGHRAAALIEAQNTMTLATSLGNRAWAAPVYYVLHRAALYFFSDPASRHIQEALNADQASSAIHASANTWQDIRGIQMSGRIRPASAGLKTVGALKAYMKKFPFVGEFFESGQSLNLEAFAKRFSVRLYCFEPDLIYYLDNRIRFGFREEISIHALM